MKYITTILLLVSICCQVHAQSNQPEKDDVIFTTVGTPPSFPGGQDSLKTYLKRNIVYPQALTGNGKEEVTFVKFIIEKDGRVSGVESMRECPKEFLDEIKRVVEKMPRWSPGKNSGGSVRCYYFTAVKICPGGCAGE